MYLHTENEVAMLSHSKLLTEDKCMANEKKFKISSRPNVTNFQPLLAFPMGHIPTTLHRFLTSSIRDFLQTDAQTHRQKPPKTIPAHSIAGTQVIKLTHQSQSAVNNSRTRVPRLPVCVRAISYAGISY